MPKPYQHRAAGTYPYYKLATWDTVSFTWRDGKRTFPTIAAATASVDDAPGKYRLSEITEDGRRDLEPFGVGLAIAGTQPPVAAS